MCAYVCIQVFANVRVYMCVCVFACNVARYLMPNEMDNKAPGFFSVFFLDVVFILSREISSESNKK